MEDSLRGILDFFAEINTLRKTPRLGWRFAGPPVGQDMVAAHIMMTAQIAFVLGYLERERGIDINPSRCAVLALFHDNVETRLGDKDKLFKHYLDTSQASLEAMRDQTGLLPEKIGGEIFLIFQEAKLGENAEAKVAHDADILEASFQAKFHSEAGYPIPPELLDKYLDESRVTTNSAKQLMVALKRAKKLSARWFLGLLPLLAGEE